MAEQFPKGGALTLNAMGGVGMLGVGVIGAMLMGNVQDKTIDQELAKNAAVHEQVTTEKTGLLGKYFSVDQDKLAKVDDTAKALVQSVQDTSKKMALKQMAVLPAIMLVCYIGILAYFKSRGGYKPVDISASH